MEEGEVVVDVVDVMDAVEGMEIIESMRGMMVLVGVGSIEGIGVMVGGGMVVVGMAAGMEGMEATEGGGSDLYTDKCGSTHWCVELQGLGASVRVEGRAWRAICMSLPVIES